MSKDYKNMSIQDLIFEAHDILSKQRNEATGVDSEIILAKIEIIGNISSLFTKIKCTKSPMLKKSAKQDFINQIKKEYS